MAAPQKRANLTFYEMLEDVNAQKNKKLRIEALHKYSCAELKQILDFTFNPHVKWLLPEGMPPFEQSKDDIGSLTKGLLRNIKKLPIFLNVADQYRNLTPVKRENIFINLLASIHPKDAILLGEMKEKKLKSFKNITPELIKEAFPNFTKVWDIKVENGKDV